MLNMNIMKYVANMLKEIYFLTDKIKEMDDLEAAKRLANRTQGYIESLTVMSNTMICTENNDFTIQMNALEYELMADLFQAMVYVADRVKNDEKLWKYCQLRDEFRAAAE